MGNSTGFAKLLSPEFKTELCSSFVIFFKVSLFCFCKDQSIYVYWGCLKLIFKYQQGIGGGFIKTGVAFSRVPVTIFNIYQILF